MAEVTYRLMRAGEEEELHRLVMRAFDEFVAPDLPGEEQTVNGIITTPMEIGLGEEPAASSPPS